MNEANANITNVSLPDRDSLTAPERDAFIINTQQRISRKEAVTEDELKFAMLLIRDQRNDRKGVIPKSAKSKAKKEVSAFDDADF